MKKARILSLLVAAVMICTLFAGCGLFGGKTVMKIGGNAISESVYAGGVSQAANYFNQNFGIDISQVLDMEIGEGVTGVDVLKENAEGFIKQYESIRIFAKENGVELTAENKKAIKDNKAQQIESAGGRKAFLDSLKESGVSESYFDYFLECQQYYLEVNEQLFTGEGAFAPNAEYIAKNADSYVRVKHVLIMAKKDAEDYEEKKALAESVVKRARAGEDFDALITELGEDPGMQSNPNGYLLDKDGYTPSGSRMVAEFSEASNALAVDGVSDIVPSDHGFHVIKRYPFTAEFIKENEAALATEFASLAFSEKITEFMNTLEVEYTDAYEKIDFHKMLGADKPLGAGAEEEHSADDGHDHSAEGGEVIDAEDAGITLTPVTE